MTTPSAGRLLIRHLSQGSALVGVLHLSRDITIVEGAAYAARLSDGRLEIHPEPVAPPPSIEEHGWAVSDWLAGAVWFRMADPEMLALRFVQAFPESNGWAVCGVTPWSLAALARDAAGHGWWDVVDGALRTLPAPLDARGMALPQVLTQYALWPDAAGAAQALTQVVSTCRGALLRFHQLLARAGRGELSLEQVRTEVRADAELWRVGAGTIDPQFCRYLAGMQARGALRADAPRTGAALRVHEGHAQAVVVELA